MSMFLFKKTKLLRSKHFPNIYGAAVKFTNFFSIYTQSKYGKF